MVVVSCASAFQSSWPLAHVERTIVGACHAKVTVVATDLVLGLLNDTLLARSGNSWFVWDTFNNATNWLNIPIGPTPSRHVSLIVPAH